MYSSRAMGILRYLDPTPMVTQRRTSDPEATKKSKLRQLKKQLSSVKRKLESLQISFEEAQGYKPSQVGCYLIIIRQGCRKKKTGI